MKSFFDLLEDYGNSEYYPLHMPGHKRRLNGFLPEKLVKADITEIEGFDNLHDPNGVILALEERAARLYGADESFYLVGGSTSGILTAVSACVPEGGHILMARNCHKSAYHTAYLRNLQVSYLEPAFTEGFSFPDAIKPSQVKDALEENEDICAVLIVSPTYEGRISDIKKIADIVHEKGKILIVDEAHGAHFGFAKGFSDSSVTLGADVVIHSVHKTLPALTQTALLHVNGDRVDREKIKRFMRIYQSSSPSYVLMASIDNAMRVVETNGEQLFADFRSRYTKMLRQLKECGQFHFLSPKKNIQDIGKLVISTAGTGITGMELSNILYRNYKLQLEMACGDYALAMFTIGDEEEAYARLTKALLEIDSLLDSVKNQNMAENSSGEELLTVYSANDMEQEYPLYQAWDMEKGMLPVAEAAGRIAGDFVALYPPGIPMLVPGERIKATHVALIQKYLELQFDIQGVTLDKGTAYIECIRTEG